MCQNYKHRKDLLELGQILAHCRHAGSTSTAPTLCLKTEADAWDVQEIASAWFAGNSVGYSVVGWSASAQRQLGLESPIYSPMHQKAAELCSGATIRLPPGTIGAQCELLLTLGCTLAAEGNEMVTNDQVTQAIVGYRPAIGLLGRRITRVGVGQLAAIADFGLRIASVAGEFTGKQAISVAGLHAVRASLNGNDVLRACNLPIDPVPQVAWLANDLLRRGQCLDAGSIVACGVLAPVLQVFPGQAIVFDIADTGFVTCAFS